VADFKFTDYFEDEVRKKPYLTKAMCIAVVQSPLRVVQQENGRFRFWGQVPQVPLRMIVKEYGGLPFWEPVPQLPGRYLRVVTLPDKLTIHNAFFDRRFSP
jgi:hypothetical protein